METVGWIGSSRRKIDPETKIDVPKTVKGYMEREVWTNLEEYDSHLTIDRKMPRSPSIGIEIDTEAQ